MLHNYVSFYFIQIFQRNVKSEETNKNLCINRHYDILYNIIKNK